jgi:hypothetical protein
VARQRPTKEQDKVVEQFAGFASAADEYMIASENVFMIEENRVPYLINLLPFYRDRHEQLREIVAAKIAAIKKQSEGQSLGSAYQNYLCLCIEVSQRTQTREGAKPGARCRPDFTKRRTIRSRHPDRDGVANFGECVLTYPTD